MIRSNRVLVIFLLFSMFSCNVRNDDQQIFDTKKALDVAELNIQLAFDSVELREAVKKLAPSQVFHNLGQFYGYAYNFGLPGCKERELFDGWGRPIRLSIAGDVVHIWSIGSDGVNQSGEGDDIRVVVHLSK